MRPMLATLADAPLSDPNLVYELKYDGIRALVTVTPARSAKAARRRSRSRRALGNDKTAQFPEVVHALARWGAGRGGRGAAGRRDRRAGRRAAGPPDSSASRIAFT